jgi:two-component system response regulator NreC
VPTGAVNRSGDATRIRVLLADDHTLMRQGIRRLLEAEPDMEVVGDVADGLMAVTEADRLQPHVVLMDYTMPGLDGQHATLKIKHRHPAIKVIILSMHEDEEYILTALRAGASGYLLKDSEAPWLLAAIRAVYSGESYLSPRISKKVIAGLVAPALLPDAPDELTPREQEILKLLAESHTLREIARLFGISAKTVDTHKHHIMKKLGLKSRTDLIKYAIRKKIIRLDT